MTYVLIASAALGGILLFLLAAATANSPLFAEHYPLLLGLNAAIALALLGLVDFDPVVGRRTADDAFGERAQGSLGAVGDHHRVPTGAFGLEVRRLGGRRVEPDPRWTTFSVFSRKSMKLQRGLIRKP